MRPAPRLRLALPTALGAAVLTLGACDKKLPTASVGSAYPPAGGHAASDGGGGAGGGATTGTSAAGGSGGTGQGGAGHGGVGQGGYAADAGADADAGGCLKCSELYDKGGDPSKLCPGSAKLYGDLQGCACPDTEDCYVACSDQLCTNTGVIYQADCWSCLLGGCKYKSADCKSDQ